MTNSYALAVQNISGRLSVRQATAKTAKATQTLAKANRTIAEPGFTSDSGIMPAG